MNLESQVTSKGMSEKLDKAGFERDTCLWWYEVPENDETFSYELFPNKSGYIVRDGCKVGGFVYPAYTLQQLWEALPKTIVPRSTWWKRLDNSGLTYSACEPCDTIEYFRNNHLPDAAGEAILWCIAEGYIKLKEDK